jgi:hypothetical protein
MFGRRLVGRGITTWIRVTGHIFISVKTDQQDLLCKLIEPCVEKRMTMAELLAHPWILTNVASGLLYSPVQPSEESEVRVAQGLT